MYLKELIKELQKYNQEADVYLMGFKGFNQEYEAWFSDRVKIKETIKPYGVELYIEGDLYES